MSDAKFRTITHFLLRRTDNFWFAIACRSDKPAGDEACLVGKVYFFKSRKAWRNTAEQDVRKRVIAMQIDGLSTDSQRRALSDSHYREAIQFLDDTADIYANFMLRRSGDVFFSAPSIKDKKLEEASIENAKKWGRNFRKDVVDQFYFFLRDITHKHQHHPPEDDTILILQERKDDKLLWRKHILFSLYYYIIGSKRADGPTSQIEAQGILAYANSFRVNCTRQLQSQADAIPEFNDSTLRASIDARIKKDEADEAHRQYWEGIRLLKSGNRRSYTLSGAAIILALAAILVQPHINNSDRSQFPQAFAASVFVTKHLLALTKMLVASTLFLWMAFSPRIPQWSFGRDLLEFANTNRKVSTPIIFLTAISTLVTTMIFKWPLLLEFAKTAEAIIKSIF